MTGTAGKDRTDVDAAMRPSARAPATSRRFAGAPTLAAALEAHGEEDGHGAGVAARLAARVTAGLPSDGMPGPGLGLTDDAGSTRFACRDPMGLAARGSWVGRIDARTVACAFADVVVGVSIDAWLDGSLTGTATLRGIKLAGEGDVALDLEALARMTGDAWLPEDDPRVTRTRDEGGPATAAFLGVAEDVLCCAGTGIDARVTLNWIGTSNPDAMTRVISGERRFGGPMKDVVDFAAKDVPASLDWTNPGGGHPRLASSHVAVARMLSRGYAVPASAVARAAARREAARRLVAWLEGRGAPAGLVARARASWPTG